LYETIIFNQFGFNQLLHRLELLQFQPIERIGSEFSLPEMSVQNAEAPILLAQAPPIPADQKSQVIPVNRWKTAFYGTIAIRFEGGEIKDFDVGVTIFTHPTKNALAHKQTYDELLDHSVAQIVKPLYTTPVKSSFWRSFTVVGTFDLHDLS